MGLLGFFDLGSEANLPTFFSALNLVLAGLLLTVIARHDAQATGHKPWAWGVLAFGFFLMSADEAAQIHEGLVHPLFRLGFIRFSLIWNLRPILGFCLISR